MKKIKYPEKDFWYELCERPVFNQELLKREVSGIIEKVKHQGDKALQYFSSKFDGVLLSNFLVSEQEIKEAVASIDGSLKRAIAVAIKNIEKFHTSQIDGEKKIQTMTGVHCWRRSLPIDRVGFYIPGGSAPLFSTIIMLAVPAKIAGCKNIVLCTPPDKYGQVNPIILYVASLFGIKNIYKIGGAQAIAAMAYGTESIQKVNKIFGPGNQYVTFAKTLVQQDSVAIDMPAGPSEVLIIADKFSNSSFVAADLLAQAEHGADSQVILLSDSEIMIDNVMKQIKHQLKKMPRRDIAVKALEKSKSILLRNIDSCIEFSNMYAPEHLILAVENYETLSLKITNAGSVFLGSYTCESVGDYASGTNHTLPTNGFAKSYSGVSLDTFYKKITFQEISKRGIQNIGPTVERMAEAEKLFGHKNAVSIRLKAIKNG